MSCTLCNDTFRVQHFNKVTRKMVWRKCRCQTPSKLHNVMMARSALSAWRTWQGDREDVDRLPFGLTLAIRTGRRAGLTNDEIAELANLAVHVVVEVD